MQSIRQLARSSALFTRCGVRNIKGLPPLTAMQMVQATGVRTAQSEASGDESEGGELFLRHLLRYPRVGERAPHFRCQAVVDKQFKEIDLSAYSGKWLVLFFYPLDFTFVCPTEIAAFSDRAADFEKHQCAVVACSTDSHFSHLAWVNTPRKEGGLVPVPHPVKARDCPQGDMKIPLLADYKKEVSTAYGVLNKDVGAAYRGLFLIDPKGVVRHMQCNDFPVGRSVDEVLRLLAAFQFVEKHGEVCPANWNPADKKATIKPDPKGSKEFFNKHG